jgi:hypothetical protein
MCDRLLGRPPKDPRTNAAYEQQLGVDQRKRNEVEGCFGLGKRNYSLDLIMARLAKGAETSIAMAFVVMCAEKFRSFSASFLPLSLSGSTPGNGQAASGWRSGLFACLRQPNHWSLYNRACELPMPYSLAAIEPARDLSYSGVPNCDNRVFGGSMPLVLISSIRYLR